MGIFNKVFKKEETPEFVFPKMLELPGLPQVRFMPSEIPDVPQYIPQRKVEFTPRGTKETVFIRLDKFEMGEKAFKEIDDTLSSIEESIRNVSKINESEDEKLLSWNKDLERTKILLVKIDERVFDQI